MIGWLLLFLLARVGLVALLLVLYSTKVGMKKWGLVIELVVMAGMRVDQ